MKKKIITGFLILCVLGAFMGDSSDTEQSDSASVQMSLEENDKSGEKKAEKEAEKKAKKKAEKEAEKKAKKKAEEKARKKAEKEAERKAAEEAEKEAERKAEEEAERKAGKEGEAEKEEEGADEKSDFWDSARNFVKGAADAVESGAELVTGYSFEIENSDYGYSLVSSRCSEYSSVYDDISYKQHLFKGYTEYTMSVSTRNAIRKDIKKKFDSYVEDIGNGEFSGFSASDDLSRITFLVEGYEKDTELSDELADEYGESGRVMADIAADVILGTVGYEYMREELFQTEWYRQAYLYQFFNRNGGNMVTVEFIDADTDEVLYTFG